MKNKALYLILLAAALSAIVVWRFSPSTSSPDKSDLIKVTNPKPNSIISSPLTVTGEARGTWYFEADFPVYLYDAEGNELAVGIARAQSGWMTENFVPFETILVFETQESGISKGTLVFKKSNPSDLPEQDDEFVMPVKISQ